MREEELTSRTSCNNSNPDQGNLVNDDSNWQLTGTLLKKTDVPIEDVLCEDSKSQLNAFLPIRGLTKEEATNMCKRLRSDVVIAGNFKSREYFDEYYSNLFENKKYVEACGHYDNGRIRTWLPYIPNDEGTALIHEKYGTELQDYFAEWYGGPNQSSDGQCVAAYFGLVPKYENIAESSCGDKKCTACEVPNSFQESVIVTLRGLCKYSHFDTIYKLDYSPENEISYIGQERSIIKFDFGLDSWVIKDVTNPEVSAVLKMPFKSLGLGNQYWTITNDNYCQKGSTDIKLSLTSCSIEEFTCNDGLCTTLDHRCDGHADCKDLSDEKGCSIVIFDDGYKKWITPKDGKHKKHPIYGSVSVYDLSSFDPVAGTFEAQFTVKLKWLDERLRYKNLFPPPRHNKLQPKEVEKLWFPYFIFDNTKKKIESIVDKEATFEVIKVIFWHAVY